MVSIASPAVIQRPKFTEYERNKYSMQNSKAHFKTPEEEYKEYAIINKKECSKCKKMKYLSEYSGNTSGSDAFDKDGYRLRRPECKVCNKKDNKGKSYAKNLAKKNGISYKAPKDTTCALCGNLPRLGKTLVFDHCHKSNKFRGYLHNSCNRALGVLGDDVQSIINAINYLNISEKKKFIQDKHTGKLIIIED